MKITLPLNDIFLDLGCGRAKDRSAIGIDIDDHGQEIIWDVEKMGIPLPDDSCRLVKAHSIMEHFFNVCFVMRELHRVIKKDGVLDVVVPMAGSNGAFRDPTHRTTWTEETFDYFTPKKPKYYNINEGYKWKILERKKINQGIITAKLTPIKE